jgi:hypothetical protein
MLPRATGAEQLDELGGGAAPRHPETFVKGRGDAEPLSVRRGTVASRKSAGAVARWCSRPIRVVRWRLMLVRYRSKHVLGPVTGQPVEKVDVGQHGER